MHKSIKETENLIFFSVYDWILFHRMNNKINIVTCGDSLIIWATSWENLFLPYANNKGADQPAHPRSLISAFVVHWLGSIIPLVSISEISSLYLASVAAQAGLSLPWSQTPKTGFLVTKLNYSNVITRILASWIKTMFKLLTKSVYQS